MEQVRAETGLPGPKNEKRPNNGQISFKKFVKITKLKFRIL